MDVAMYGFTREAERMCTWIDCREIFTGNVHLVRACLWNLLLSSLVVVQGVSRFRDDDARIIIPGSGNSAQLEFLIASNFVKRDLSSKLSRKNIGRSKKLNLSN